MKKVKICDGEVIFALQEGGKTYYTVYRKGLLYKAEQRNGKLQPSNELILLGGGTCGACAGEQSVVKS